MRGRKEKNNNVGSVAVLLLLLLHQVAVLHSTAILSLELSDGPRLAAPSRGGFLNARPSSFSKLEASTAARLILKSQSAANELFQD